MLFLFIYCILRAMLSTMASLRCWKMYVVS
jgi:hypothetical protein